MPKRARLERRWYHGSPLQLTELAAGSTITPWRRLARAFSHKPAIVSLGDDGTVHHNGVEPGILYQVDETLTPEDVTPHPRSTMGDGVEWLTTRPLRLKRLGRAKITKRERLTEAELQHLRERLHEGSSRRED